MNWGLRSRLALFLLALILLTCAYLGIKQLLAARSEAEALQKNGDPFVQWSERLQPLLPNIPETGIIGYLSERDLPGLDFNPIDQEEEFVMTQYFLAPRILKEDTEQEYTVGNFAGPTKAELQKLVEPFGLEVRAAYPQGIFLLVKIHP